jgi:hypothetical protein
MAIEVLRNMTPAEVRHAVDGFSARYVADWDLWLAAPPTARPRRFGEILRRWQATRPKPMRRIRVEADHGAPFLEDLLDRAVKPVLVLGDKTVATIGRRSIQEDDALRALWDIFSHLSETGLASCVGITKSVLLVTDGRIGPALDSSVRAELGVARAETCRDWLEILEAVGDDILAFEARHGALAEAVAPRFGHLAYGRLYDMVLGPR